jgi:tRNA threonylcarbamoyladenosine biosynthesis protein TsaE
METVFISKSAEETQKIAQNLALKYIDGGIIALNGDLGAGKTTFTQGFAKGLKVEDKIISPTFVLIRQHKIAGLNKMLFHIDLYRMEGEVNIEELGIQEILDDPQNIVLIEWADKIREKLPQNTTFIAIEKLLGNERKIKLHKNEPH